MSGPPPHPWNHELWSLLEERERQQRLPHALMLYGRSGLGRAALALHFAGHRLIAGDPNPERAATLFNAATHPDLHLLATEAIQQRGGLFGQYAERYLEPRKGAATAKSGPRTTITIAQVRALNERLSSSPGIADSRTVVLHPTEALHLSAANALLKLLEEPPPHTMFLLIAENLSRIPPTIRSRCMVLTVAPPPAAVAVPWLSNQTGLDEAEAAALLALAGGAPLAAAELHERGAAAFHRELMAYLAAAGEAPAAAPASWAEQGAPVLIAFLLSIVSRTIRARLSGDRGADTEPALPLALPISGLFRLYDRLCHLKRIHDPVLDQQLLLDDLAQFIHRARRPGPIQAPATV